MNRKAIFLIAPVIIIIVFLLFLFSSKGVGYWHVYHLVTEPQDLYAPIVVDDFHFYTKDYAKEYALNPKYRDTHEVIIASAPNTIPSGWGKEKRSYEFEGRIKFELFSHGEKILEEEVADWDSIGYQKKP